jgi:hypothetical protein
LRGFDGDLEARTRYAFRRALTDDTWYTGNEEEKFRAALGAVLLSLALVGKREEYDLVERSMRALHSLSAAMSGIPIDWSSAFSEEDLLPLLGWWSEVCHE